MIVTEAGVDTWSPSWYVNPDGPAASWFREHATIPGPTGSHLLPEKIDGHRVGWFPSGLVFAEGHPDPNALAAPAGLPARTLRLQDAIVRAGVPLNTRQRPFRHLGADSEGWAGVRRVDATVNLATPSSAEGLAVLAGIAACVRDAPGHAEVRFGTDRAVETVYLRGPGGKRALGRWYDKGLESRQAPRGQMIRAEDQRRWGKLERPDATDLTPEALRLGFHRRFYPLWKATRGVTVGGPFVLAEKVMAAVQAGRIGQREAESLCGHMLLSQVSGRRGASSRRTMYRREARARELGIVLGDGVLQEVEVDVAAVLEAALETDAWNRRG